MQVGNVDAHLHGAGAGQPANVPLSQRFLDAFPAHQALPVGHGVPCLNDDGVLGDAPGRLYTHGGPLRQLPVVDERDVGLVGILTGTSRTAACKSRQPSS